jgi:hypothetical protein
MTHRFETDEGPLDLPIEILVVAGWTGRNKAAVQHHIEELQAIGVPAPSRTPLFYRVGAALLTQAPAIQVVGADTSGEAEAVLIAGPDTLYVGLGSDHTDRAAEAISVALSKQLCPKPVGPQLWRYDDVAPHWDELILRSWAWIDGRKTPYQEGTLSGMLQVQTLLSDHGDLLPGTAMFCGTLPALDGIRPAPRFEMTLEDPVLGRTIRHGYEISVLPAVA